MVVDSATIEECWSSLCDIRRVTRVSVRITTMGRSVATARECSEAGGARKMEVCVTSLLLPVRMVGSGNSSHYHCYCPWDTPANSAIQVHLAGLDHLTEILPSSRESGEQCSREKVTRSWTGRSLFGTPRTRSWS